ncbi:hypothetical protein RF11_00371 [Thelohanellus kitauei]|uniref:Uncharacterized protein n=1 Tax=Thelohanellus kitauei TaxID=669202 RepID=A0A0C2N423_THEKT|nr:hypothetical protein RF11_00371 [Thelohanellus kitauei]
MSLFSNKQIETNDKNNEFCKEFKHEIFFSPETGQLYHLSKSWHASKTMLRCTIHRRLEIMQGRDFLYHRKKQIFGLIFLRTCLAIKRDSDYFIFEMIDIDFIHRTLDFVLSKLKPTS